jgi:hypothetical protein
MRVGPIHSPLRVYRYVLMFSPVVGLCATTAVSFGQTQNAPSPKITVRLSVPNRTFTVREVIHVEVRVSNKGDAPILVTNTVSMATGGISHLDFELADVRGRVSPGIRMISDYFPSTQTDENAAVTLLRSWTLLYPSTSLLFDIPIDQSVFKFLGKPGKYTLSATYASNGISYGLNRLGLSDDVLKSLPYQSWSGKMSTNEISLTIVTPRSRKSE